MRVVVSPATLGYIDLISGRRRGAAPTLQRGVLRAASWPYGCAVWLRNRLYDRGWRHIERASVPVICIGNLTVGGTGKTPCVECVARFLSEDYRVAILSRGYGQRDGPNDEALVLEENLPDVPHLQGADRAELARLAVEELESEVVILDDGFQHRRLARQLDLVLIDATNPWGYGYLTPRGLLRESPRELRRAQAVIITRCDLVAGAQVRAIRERVACYANLPVFESIHRPLCLVNSEDASQPLENAAKRPVAAFCGLGNPNAFHATLERLGPAPTMWKTFPDHHSYTRRDVEALEEWAARLPDGGFVLTTQKDLVKLRLARLGDRPLWAVKIGLEIRDGEERLRRMIADAVR
jgi:tetraacyldisaccharide 4'-kinase